MLIDFESNEPIVCECGEKDNLAIVQFVFGSRVDCETCGRTVA